MHQAGEQESGRPDEPPVSAPTPNERRTTQEQFRDIAVAGFFTAVGTIIAVTAWRTPEPFRSVDVLGPNRFPLIVGIGIAIFGLFVMLKTAYHYSRGTFQDGQFEIPGQANDEPGKPASGLRVAGVMALLVIHVVLWDVLGFLLASFLFVVIGMRMMSERSLRLVLTTAVGYSVITFVLFGLLLDVALPLGIEESLFVRLGIVESVR